MGDQEFSTKASPSLLYQNLTFGDNKFCYVHKAEAQLVNIATKETSSIQAKDKAPVSQVKVIDLHGAKVLALLTQASTQFWDVAKEKCLFTVPNSEAKDSFLSRGIAAVDNQVMIGYSNGSIALIEAGPDSGSVTQMLKEHREVITDIASGVIDGQPLWVSADLAGEAIVWSGATVAARLDRVVEGDCCTCICITPVHVVCGYGSGKLRCFTPAGVKVVEVNAHCRWINALDYCLQTNTLVSASEDMLLQFWTMPTVADPKISLKGHKLLKDALLSGVKFTDDGSRVAVAAYDTEKLFVFQAP